MGQRPGFVVRNVQEAVGVRVNFIRQVTSQTNKRYRQGTCRSAAAARVLKKAGTQTLGTYIYKRQATVEYWLESRPIIEVCDRETGYKRGVRRREPWWRKTAARKQLSATLEEILEEARARCWEFRRNGEDGGCREVAESDAGRYGPQYDGTETGDARLGE